MMELDLVLEMFEELKGLKELKGLQVQTVKVVIQAHKGLLELRVKQDLKDLQEMDLLEELTVLLQVL